MDDYTFLDLIVTYIFFGVILGLIINLIYWIIDIVKVIKTWNKNRH